MVEARDYLNRALQDFPGHGKAIIAPLLPSDVIFIISMRFSESLLRASPSYVSFIPCGGWWPAPSYCVLGLISQQEGDIDQAETYYRTALEIHANNVPVSDDNARIIFVIKILCE